MATTELPPLTAADFFSPTPSSLALIAELTEGRTKSTLNRLIRSHNNGTITAQEALSGIATIAGLRGLLEELSTRVKTSLN